MENNPFHSRSFSVHGRRYAWAYLDTYNRLNAVRTWPLRKCMQALEYFANRPLQARVRSALERRIDALATQEASHHG